MYVFIVVVVLCVCCMFVTDKEELLLIVRLIINLRDMPSSNFWRVASFVRGQKYNLVLDLRSETHSYSLVSRSQTLCRRVLID